MKRLLVCLFLSMLVVSTAGCGGSTKDNKQPQLGNPPDEKTGGPAAGKGGGAASQQKSAVD